MSDTVDDSIKRIRKIINESDMLIDEDKWLVIELLNRHKKKQDWNDRPFQWKEMHKDMRDFDDT